MKTLGLLSLIFFLFSFYFFSCGPSLRVGHDFDVEKDFNVYKTFDFITNPDNSQMNILVIKRIIRGVKRELTEKGLTFSEENPDLRIAFYHTEQSRLNVSTWGYGYAPYAVYVGGYGYWGSYRIDTYEYKRGSLIIDLVESESKHMVWRGVAEGALPDIPRSEQIDRIVNDAVKKIMKNYPPKKK